MWRSQSQDSDNNEDSSCGPDAADAMTQICKSSVLLASTEVNSSSPLRQQRQFLKKSLNSLLSPRRRLTATAGKLNHQPSSIDESILEEIEMQVKFQGWSVCDGA